MTKIMLVEDDKSLREIYSIRLVAEGYEVVSAGDGEEALAMAVQQRPNLILSDVMMPKISGFDMLDILRSTPETKDIRVIMMTALSSEDQRQRGENLGADRYLVKSQVGIEDVINAVHEVLGDMPGPERFAVPSVAAATTSAQPAVATSATSTQPVTMTAPEAPQPTVTPAASNVATSQPTAVASAPIATPSAEPTTVVAPTTAATTPVLTPEDELALAQAQAQMMAESAQVQTAAVPTSATPVVPTTVPAAEPAPVMAAPATPNAEPALATPAPVPTQPIAQTSSQATPQSTQQYVPGTQQN